MQNQYADREREERWIFLLQAESENEANIIESVLDSQGIPVRRRYREAGEYLKIYMGMTNFGVDIYVPQSAEEQARDLIAYPATEEPDDNTGR